MITYDKEVKLAYIDILPPSKLKVMHTEELEINDEIMLDIDEEDRIVGLELFGESTKKCNHLLKQKKYTPK